MNCDAAAPGHSRADAASDTWIYRRPRLEVAERLFGVGRTESIVVRTAGSPESGPEISARRESVRVTAAMMGPDDVTDDGTGANVGSYAHGPGFAEAP